MMVSLLCTILNCITTCVIFYLILRNTNASKLCDNDGDTFNNGYCEPEDCGLEKRTPADIPFLCKIKRLRDRGIIRETKDIATENLYDSDKAPTITRVSLRVGTEMIDKQKVYNPTLNISFTLPCTNKTVIKAILLTFTSVQDSDYKDNYYFNCPQYLFFEFASYVPPDSGQYRQRELQYPCLKGLEERFKRPHVYIVNLTSFNDQYLPLHNLQHQITAHAYSRLQGKYFGIWTPTIVTTIIPGTSYVRVVFEPIESRYAKVKTYYKITLYDADNECVATNKTVFHKFQKYECILKNTNNGLFVVKLNVYKHRRSLKVQEAVSYKLNIFGENKRSLPSELKRVMRNTENGYCIATIEKPSSHTFNSTVLLAAFGSILGVILVCLSAIVSGHICKSHLPSWIDNSRWVSSKKKGKVNGSGVKPESEENFKLNSNKKHNEGCHTSLDSFDSDVVRKMIETNFGSNVDLLRSGDNSYVKDYQDEFDIAR